MRRAWSPWDRFYRDHQAPWRGERDLARVAPWLGGGPVLELGCGNGKALRPLRRLVSDAVGLDLSWHALRRLAGPRVLADAAVLPFRSGAFTAVLDFHCTGHLAAPARQAALGEAARVLAPGGTFWQERLGPRDLRAGQGEPVAGQPGLRVRRDGRATCFLDGPDLLAEVEAAGMRVEEQGQDVVQPTHRGVPVVRQGLWLRARRV